MRMWNNSSRCRHPSGIQTCNDQEPQLWEAELNFWRIGCPDWTPDSDWHFVQDIHPYHNISLEYMKVIVAQGGIRLSRYENKNCYFVANRKKKGKFCGMYSVHMLNIC